MQVLIESFSAEAAYHRLFSAVVDLDAVTQVTSSHFCKVAWEWGAVRLSEEIRDLRVLLAEEVLNSKGIGRSMYIGAAKESIYVEEVLEFINNKGGTQF